MSLKREGSLEFRLFRAPVPLALVMVIVEAFILVLFNSAKGGFEITNGPCWPPADRGRLSGNVAKIWTSPNVLDEAPFFSQPRRQ